VPVTLRVHIPDTPDNPCIGTSVLKVRPLIHEDGGRVGANESSGIPRPIPRDPATPLRMARRDAALLCSAGGFSARRDEELRGALGVGGDGRGRVRVGRAGGLRLLV
jgi:hypothetical protein